MKSESPTKKVKAKAATKVGSVEKLELKCNFCGNSQNGVRLIAGGGGTTYICWECVDAAADIVAEARAKTKEEIMSAARRFRRQLGVERAAQIAADVDAIRYRNLVRQCGEVRANEIWAAQKQRAKEVAKEVAEEKLAKEIVVNVESGVESITIRFQR